MQLREVWIGGGGSQPLSITSKRLKFSMGCKPLPATETHAEGRVWVWRSHLLPKTGRGGVGVP